MPRLCVLSIDLTIRYIILVTFLINYSHMAIDWTKIYKKYKGLWVALQADEQTVIASGKTAKQAWKLAKDKGFSQPVITKMPKELVTYVGSGL
jgi:hypothetical protein